MDNLWSAVSGILLLNLVLSGDNAIVIGAAAAEAPKRQRFYAILVGGLGAVVLRILLASFATILLNIQWLQTIGSIALLVIAIRLLASRYQIENTQPDKTSNEEQRSFFAVTLTVLVADLTMSLDNVLAIGALANGNISVLTIGILLSLIFLSIGSTIVATLMDRFKWLIDVAALVLAWTSASMILSDLQSSGILEHFPWFQIVIPVITFAIVIAADIFFNVRNRHQKG